MDPSRRWRRVAKKPSSSETSGASRPPRRRWALFPSDPGKPPPRAPWAQAVQFEDILLLLWLLAAEAVLMPAVRHLQVWSQGSVPGGWPWSVWLVIASLVFLVFTRGKADTSLDTGVLRRVLLVLPAFPVLSLVAAAVSLIRGGPRSLRVLGGDEAEWPMPTAPEWLRRTAALPAILLGESIFREELGRARPSLREAIAPTDLAEGTSLTSYDRAAAVGAELFLLAIPFLLMVVGPRVAAGATADWRFWVVRFLLFATAAAVGSTVV
jgi:hypothetical protein